jgi:DNA-binding CsgD family transcriptional regulator
MLDALPQQLRDRYSHGMEALTGRETELFNLLVSTDLQLKEIAFHLGVSVKTADAFKVSVFRKLNVRTRVELIHWAYSKGLMKPKGRTGGGNECAGD